MTQTYSPLYSRNIGTSNDARLKLREYDEAIARFPQEAVIELADQLLYAAKHDGRNTVRALEFYGRPGLHVATRAAG